MGRGGEKAIDTNTSEKAEVLLDGKLYDVTNMKVTIDQNIDMLIITSYPLHPLYPYIYSILEVLSLNFTLAMVSMLHKLSITSISDLER